MAPKDTAGKDSPDGMYALALGMVGVEAAIAFTKFVKEADRMLTVDDVFKGKVKKGDIDGLANSTVQALIENLGHHCKDNNWTLKQSEQVAKFAKMLPGEQMVAVWNGVSRSSNIKNIQKMHKLLGQEVVAQVQASRNLGKK